MLRPHLLATDEADRREVLLRRRRRAGPDARSGSALVHPEPPTYRPPAATATIVLAAGLHTPDRRVTQGFHGTECKATLVPGCCAWHDHIESQAIGVWR